MEPNNKYIDYKFSVSSYNKNIIISNPYNLKGKILIYDIIGNELYNIGLNDDKKIIEMKITGIYFVEIITSKKIFNKKILIY